MPAITFIEFEPATDVDPLVAFLAVNAFPFHARSRVTEEQARDVVLGGRYWSADAVGLWVEADGERVGIAVIDDLGDVVNGGNPVFDVGLAEARRGHGLGVGRRSRASRATPAKTIWRCGPRSEAPVG